MVEYERPQERQSLLWQPLLLAVDVLIADDLGAARGERLAPVANRLAAAVVVLLHLLKVNIVPNSVTPEWKEHEVAEHVGGAACS